MNRSTPTPLKVATFDREKLSLEVLSRRASHPQGRAELELWRQDISEKRRVIADYCKHQLAEADELLQRLDLVLEGGVRA